MPFLSDAIIEIRFGPRNFALNDKESVRLFLESNGYDLDKIKLINSEVSYGP
jgi:hypothetical protein